MQIYRDCMETIHPEENAKSLLVGGAAEYRCVQISLGLAAREVYTYPWRLRSKLLSHSKFFIKCAFKKAA